jgi:hypothetical protein
MNKIINKRKGRIIYWFIMNTGLTGNGCITPGVFGFSYF